MARSKAARRPPGLERAAARAVGRFARQAAVALLEKLSPLPAGELPGDNRVTEVELTLVGIEDQVAAPAVTAESLLAYLRAQGITKPPTILILDTNIVGEYVVVLQFKVELDWPADRAAAECQLQCSRLVDGRSVLGYGVRVVGVR